MSTDKTDFRRTKETLEKVHKRAISYYLAEKAYALIEQEADRLKSVIKKGFRAFIAKTDFTDYPRPDFASKPNLLNQ